MKTEVYIWSALGHTPKTKRQGAYYDVLKHGFIDADDPQDAKEKVLALIRKIPHAASGHFNIPKYPNQNTRSQFVHPEIRLMKTNPRKRTKSRLTRARAAKLQAKHYLNKKFGKFAGARRNPSGVRIVYNKLLGGWYVVRGPHQTPLNGRFNSKAEAQAYLRGDYRRNPRRKSRRRIHRNSIQKKPVHRKSIVLAVKAGNHWVPLKVRYTSKEKAVAEARRMSKYWRAPIKISTER